jgi:hypothetical protein
VAVLVRQPLEKLIRILARSREPHHGDEGTAGKTYTDEIQAFFVAAYHVKDYVQKEGAIWLDYSYPPARVKLESEALFHGDNVTLEMAFTHDLCNGIKHAELLRPKRHITRIIGFRMFSKKRDDGSYDLVTAYLTPDGVYFADDVMETVLSSWLEFIDSAYLEGVSNPIRRILAKSGNKPESIKNLQATAEDALRAGVEPAKMPIHEEMPESEDQYAAYWNDLPALPVPDVPNLDVPGTIVWIEEIQLLDASGEQAAAIGIGACRQEIRLPAVHVATEGGLARIRLPLDYAEILGSILATSESLGESPFPSFVEFGKLAGRSQFGGYYFEFLANDKSRIEATN